MGEEGSNPDYDEPAMDDARRKQLLDEAGNTVSGLLKKEDPRGRVVLDEEAERLNRIADTLIPPLD
jgi:hypothetical protein